MAKTIDNNSQDAQLNDIKNNGNLVVLLSAQATTFNEANSTFRLASAAIAAADFGALVAGAAAGSRRLNVPARNGAAVSTGGTGNHVAVIDTVNSRVKLQTSTPAQAVSQGGTADIAAWTYDVNQPA